MCPASRFPKIKINQPRRMMRFSMAHPVNLENLVNPVKQTVVVYRIKKIFRIYRIVLLGLLMAACNSTDSVNSNKTPVISNPPTGTTYPMPPTRTASLANMGWQLADGKRSIFSDLAQLQIEFDCVVSTRGSTETFAAKDCYRRQVGRSSRINDDALNAAILKWLAFQIEKR